MNTDAVSLVLFNDTLEDEPENHYGILFDNGFILCLCCGGYLEPEDYEIIEDYNGFEHLDEVLKKYY